MSLPRSTRPPRLLLLLALSAVSLTACRKAAGPQTQPGIVQDVALTQAASCDALQQTVADAAVKQMRLEIDAEKEYDGCCVLTPVAAGGDTNGASSGASSAPASYSTTNVQVSGVDESDFVKNDGTRIFSLSGQTLYATTSWPATDLALAGKLDIEGWPTDMFLDGNRVVVFSGIWTEEGGSGAGGVDGPAVPVGGGAISCPLDGEGCFFGSATTKITVVDVTNLAAPQVTAQLYLPGNAYGARRVGSSVRLVLNDQVRWPDGLQWWPSDYASASSDHDAWVAALDALEDANEAIIRAAPLSSWFPEGQRTLTDGTSIDLTYQCSDFYLSNAPETLGLVTVATLDLDNLDAGISRANIVGSSDILYSTADHLYLASEHWWWYPVDGQQDWTYLHEFDISDPAKSVYVASGGVQGHLGDQFALDEQDGYLRVASSTATYSTSSGAVDGYLVGSRLSVLAPEKGQSGAQQLTLVGEITSLEDNEELTAMRFVGNSGFAVTFRAVDPLVTLDLSDPRNPKKVAELTVPGFSTYLQPIDATHLLAIGEDFPVDSSGVPDYDQRSMQVSLFDVSDLAHPSRTANIDVGTNSAYSDALWDHHAFNWYQPDPTKPGVLAIPFSDWSDDPNDPWGDFVSDVRFFSVNAGGGTVTALGALGMDDVFVDGGDADWSYWYRPWVRRSVLSTAQDGTIYAYAISDAGLRVANLSAPSAPLATALYPQAAPGTRAARAPKKR